MIFSIRDGMVYRKEEKENDISVEEVFNLKKIDITPRKLYSRRRKHNSF
jgi:hypothetical protein